MIILHDGNPLTRIRRPYVNWALIAICIAVFALQYFDVFRWKFYAFFPFLLLGPENYPFPFAIPWDGWLGLVTHLFLHGDVLHLAANMTALFVFGNNIEDALGHWRYLLFYLACGMLAALGQGWMEPTTPLIGASGAIAGVMGGYLLLHPRARILILAFNIAPVMAPAAVVVGFNVVVNIAMAYDVTLLSGGPPDPANLHIAWYAHITGFLLGLALVPLLKARDVRLFQAPPLAPGRAATWLGRVVPSLTWPGDYPLPGSHDAAVAEAEHPTRAMLLVFIKAFLYVALILALLRFVP
jgi:membrane associated rhomboid family serine protease